MKKFTALFIAALMSASTVFASVPHLRKQPSDIKVFLHGKEIPSCAVNNSMYISAEDFKEYGYTVTYVDDVRTLFVNKTGEPSDIMPEPCAVEYLQETDIQVILNGKFMGKYSAYAANGKMYLNASAVTDPSYFLSAKWDGVSRSYSIDDSTPIPKEEQIENFLSYGGNRANYTFLSFTENRYRGEDFDIVSLRVGGLPHGSATSWMYFGDDGRSFSINTVAQPFRMHNAWGNNSIENPRIEGRKLYFDGRRTMNLADLSDGGIYEGTYCLDLDTTVVTVVKESKVY